MRADYVGGVARRLDIGPVLRRDLLAVVAHHGCEFDHLLAQLAAYLLGALPDRLEQCLALSDHLLCRLIGLIDETERDFDGLIAAKRDPLVERVMFCSSLAAVLALSLVHATSPVLNP